jgi:hypothetical protein
MTKKYAKGYTYSFFSKSLISPSMIVLSNKLPYGNGRLESQVFVEQGTVRMLITDGFKFIYDKKGFNSIKQAMNIAHGKMEELTHNTYNMLD